MRRVSWLHVFGLVWIIAGSFIGGAAYMRRIDVMLWDQLLDGVLLQSCKPLPDKVYHP